MCIGCAIGGAALLAGSTYAGLWFLFKKVVPFLRGLRGEKVDA